MVPWSARFDAPMQSDGVCERLIQSRGDTYGGRISSAGFQGRGGIGDDGWRIFVNLRHIDLRHRVCIFSGLMKAT